jgi:hypothetical protein
MRVFLDFEASSLSDDSYPIEVGWVLEDGREEEHLIRPAPGWTDWDPSAEAMHGLSRDELLAKGEPHDAVARRVLDALSSHTVYVSAPSWDGKWLSVLLRAADLPRHSMRFRDSDEAMIEAAREAGLDEAVAVDLVESMRRAAAGRPVRHHALDDARQERDLWLEVGQKARSRAAAAARP